MTVAEVEVLVEPCYCAVCGARLPGRPRKGQQRRYCPRPRRCRQKAYEVRHGIKPGRLRQRRGE